MKLIRNFFAVFIFCFALFVGYKGGQKFDLINALFGTTHDEVAIPGVPIPKNDQYNLLLIGMNELGKSGAQLESIWLVAHANDTSKVSLIPVFPSLANPVQNLILADAFKLENGKPGKEFWSVLRNTNLWWNAYILTDISMAIQVIDQMGGIEIHNQHLNGSQVIRIIPSWESNPFIAVEYQRLLLEGICKKISENQKNNLKATSELIRNNLHSFTKKNLSFTTWATQSELPQKLICAFPTLEQAPTPPTTANQ